MRIDLSDRERLGSIAEALGRLFWCLMAVAVFAAILGSAGTGLLVLILGGTAFVGRGGIEDFIRARMKSQDCDKPDIAQKPRQTAESEPEFTVYRSGRPRRHTKSAV